jgi:hypothetical protein
LDKLSTIQRQISSVPKEEFEPDEWQACQFGTSFFIELSTSDATFIRKEWTLPNSTFDWPVTTLSSKRKENPVDEERDVTSQIKQPTYQ